MLQWAQLIKLTGSGSDIKPQTLARKICPLKTLSGLKMAFKMFISENVTFYLNNISALSPGMCIKNVYNT